MGDYSNVSCVGVCGGLMRCGLCRYMRGNECDVGCVGLCGGMNEMQVV